MEMVRKFGLLLVGAAIGALSVLAVLSGLNHGNSAQAAGVSTYRQLSIFGEIFERVRASYVTEPAEDELIESAIKRGEAAIGAMGLERSPFFPRSISTEKQDDSRSSS